MEKDINKIIEQAFNAHKDGKLEEAKHLYLEILKTQPENINIYNNLGIIFKNLGKLEEAETIFKKAVELNPNFVDALINLGNLYQTLDKLEEAEINFNKAIKYKPDHAIAYNNLGLVMVKLHKTNEAAINFEKAIKFKPDYAEAYYNFGVLNFKLNKLELAEKYYKKALDNKSDYAEAYNNLSKLIKEKELTKILQKQKKRTSFKKMRLIHNPFTLERKVDVDLVNDLHKIKTTKLNENIADVGYLRYGNGICSDYNLFEKDSILINNIAKDLTKIMEKAVKSKIYIMESFFNIFGEESGITKHCHLNSFDKENKLINQKFSLVYYVNIGDQNSTQPGILKLYSPDKEILPSEGQIIIFPANQMHSAAYNGKSDRVMIGVNFYSLN